MRANCEFCEAGIDVPYVMLGAPIECPDCGRQTVPKLPGGSRVPLSGSEINFGDFQQLISYPDYQSAVGRLLFRWYGYRLATSSSLTRVLSPSSAEIDQLELHQRIQTDSDKQSALYQTAMSLWR